MSVPPGPPLGNTCRKGHPWTAENTRWQRGRDGSEHRACRICRRLNQKIWRGRATRREQEPPPLLTPDEAARLGAAIAGMPAAHMKLGAALGWWASFNREGETPAGAGRGR